jgi:hypothetical protein
LVIVIARLDRAIQYALRTKYSAGGSYWMPAFAGMTSENVDGRDKPGHDHNLSSTTV